VGTARWQRRGGTFVAVNVAPARHTVTENGIPAFVEVGSGEESYVRLDWNMHANRPPIPAL
jgi:hypothetical protein